MNVQFAWTQDPLAALAATIETAWAEPARLHAGMRGPVRDAVDEVMARLDDGTLRVAEEVNGAWRVNHWLIHAILVGAHIDDYALAGNGPGGSVSWDKGPSKFAGWDEARFRASGIRALPGALVRYGAFVDRDVILMPSFVSWGARIGAGSAIDSWATVGSCAQIGRNVHLSAGATIGGVIEPAGDRPVILEDDCFVGAGCGVVEGVRVGRGAVVATGTFLSASTKIVDRATGEVFRREVPPYAVVVPGSLPGEPLPDGSPGPAVACAVIIKRVDAATRAKASVNELFRV